MTELTTQEWETELAKAAQIESSGEDVTTFVQTLSTRNKTFSLGDTDLGDEIDVVVGASTFENAYYDKPYDPSNITSPACFAIGESQDDLSPHENSPNPQADSCANCPKNEFGSATVGKGKACKNNRRLALYAFSDNRVSKDQFVILRLAPTSLKNYAKYSKAITSTFKRPTYSVITTIKFDKKSTYPLVTFNIKDPIQDMNDVKFVMDSQSMLKESISEPYKIDENLEQQEEVKKSKMS